MLLLCAVSFVQSQFVEDALRYSSLGLGVGARTLGLGTAYTGIAEGFSSVYWNPAGLAQSQLSEISLGLSHLSYGNNSTFVGQQQSFTNSATSLNSFGIVYPYPTTRGSLVFALGYGRQTDFTTGLSFNSFNPRNSIVQTWARDNTAYPNDLSDNIAYQLYLANLDTASGTFDSKILDSTTQSSTVLEGGGLNHVALSGAVEAARNLYLGITLNFITGSYSYTRNYYEDDLKNIYNNTRFPFDFTSLSLLETVESDVSGFAVKLGLLYKLSPDFRIGLAVKTPSYITVRETFSMEATSTFDNGDHYTYPAGGAYPSQNEYDVHSPFVFSIGSSYNIRHLMVSGDIEYTDWTQMEFANANSGLLALNTSIKKTFRPTANLRLGGEYNFEDAGFALRGGFMYLPSPYQGDPSSFGQKYITGGLGFIIDNSIGIDLGYAYGYWDTYHQVYQGVNTTVEKITTHNLLGTVSYRF